MDHVVKAEPVATNEELHDEVGEYRAMAKRCREYLESADRMIVAKKRKLPLEPVLPPLEPAAQPVAAEPVVG